NEDLDNDNEKYTYEPADPTSIEQLLNSKERNILIKKAIDNLPINQKLVLQLFYYEGFHYQEVSEILNISVSAVESLLFRARKNLKKYLANFNIDNNL
ncbi:MAG TPA: RNA polymerase sigma factor, partial [Bacteroidales bacterium]|nr:RNA polymerase sigma factor [Bacteroidales bacterium]